jgi:hypothetical protein
MKPARKPIKGLDLNTPYEHMGVAIVGPHGNIWGPYVFESQEAAYRHLHRFWKGNFKSKEWKLVPARSVTTAIKGEKPYPIDAPQ